MIGSDYRRPRTQMLGVRGWATRSTTPIRFFVPNHSPKVFVEGEVDMVCSAGYNPGRLARGWSLDEIDIRLVVTQLVRDGLRRARSPSCGCAACIPGRHRPGAAGHWFEIHVGDDVAPACAH